jgi:chaperone BCS1
MFISSYTERGNVSTCYEIGQYGPVSMGANTRKLESVFIDSASKNKILESVYSLDHKKEIYQRAGINRTLGVMLFGPPGTGKTSFILGLANELNRSVYYVDFSTQTEQKATYLKRMKPNSFLVLEDIDTIPSFKVRDDSKAEHQKDLGKLLKILDGAQLPDNTIIFATTNYIDRIDPAVKRFGRFDVHCELGHANKELAAEMVNYIDSSKLSILDQLTFPVSQAEIQARVLKSVIGSESEYTPIVEDEDTPEEDTEKVASMEYGPVSLRQIIRRRRMGRT